MGNPYTLSYHFSLFCSSIIFTINNIRLIVFWLNLTFLTELVYLSYTTLLYNYIVSKMGTYVELIIMITFVLLIYNYLRFIDHILSLTYNLSLLYMCVSFPWVLSVSSSFFLFILHLHSSFFVWFSSSSFFFNTVSIIVLSIIFS